MFVFTKKDIIFYSIMITFVIGATFLPISITKDKVVTTISKDAFNNFKIVIDAGHGTPDEGAENQDGLTEAAINLKIALKVQNLLEQSGCTVILTRSDENGIYDAKSNTIKQMKVSDIRGPMLNNS